MGIHKDVLVGIHDLGPLLALGQLEFELEQHAHEHHLDLGDGKVPPRAGLAAVAKRQGGRVCLARNVLVHVGAVVCVALAVAAHGIEQLRVGERGWVVGVVVAGPGDAGAFGDMGAVFEGDGDEGQSLRVDWA